MSAEHDARVLADAKASVAAQDEKLRILESSVAQIAQSHATPVFLAMMRVIVEMLCATQGRHFIVHNKIRFYTAVMGMLQKQGLL